MTEPVKWGLLSTAAINDAVLAGCSGSHLVTFRAVASRTLERATRWAAPRGIEFAYGSYAELLEDPEIEAVYISLPNALHIEWSIKALEAGKHVLCEKPLSSDQHAVRSAFDASDSSRRILAEAFMYRFHPQSAEVLRLIADGTIGSVRHLHATLSFAIGEPTTDVRTSSALEGGALMDVGCYCVSAFRLFVGEAQQALAYGVPGPTGIDTRFVGILVSADGVIGQFDCAMDLPRRDRLELVGTRGVIELADPWHCRGAPVTVRLPGEPSREISVPPEDAYRSEFEAVSDAIRTRTPIPFGRADALAQARTLTALMSAATTGSRTNVPLEQ